MIRHLSILIQPPRRLLSLWLAHYRVLRRNPGAAIQFPVQWTVDDFAAVHLAPGSLIGVFSDIFVRRRSPHTPVSGELEVGACAVVGSQANLRAEGGTIRIGANCLLAQGVALIAANHVMRPGALFRELPVDQTRTGVTLGENVWLAAGVTVLPGCTVGDGAVVGAGSVVTRDVPPGEVWAGVPARKLRSLHTSSLLDPAPMSHKKA